MGTSSNTSPSCSASGDPGTEGNYEWTCTNDYGGAQPCSEKCCVYGTVVSCIDSDTRKRTDYSTDCTKTETELDCPNGKVCEDGKCVKTGGGT